MAQWCTIESDPGVFTCLIQNFGVENAQLTELYSLDDDSLQNVIDSYGKVHGLIFLFKWQQEETSNKHDATAFGDENSDKANAHTTNKTDDHDHDVPDDLFFAKQVIHNACATQALLSILLNSRHTMEQETTMTSTTTTTNGDSSTSSSSGSLNLGPTLLAFKSFTESFPPDLKGEAIGASDEIRNVHNSFARKEAFLMDDESSKRVATKDDEVFHFVAYVPHANGTVYELDGLQNSPIAVGAFVDSTIHGQDDQQIEQHNDLSWLVVARRAIQQRIERYQTSEIKFNLMALTQDRRSFLKSQKRGMLEAGLSENDAVIEDLNYKVLQEEELRKQWADENERRRHNYLPFCMELIRELAKSGLLQNYTKRAGEKTGVSMSFSK
mmetsp:Transcript_597/g.1079  ORF Transcript_597/g.1079 Transcript_597/m.1079 type:complete len:383 (+) Transcript_597:100-1248(+)|eukprot:CAMPEP_0176476426 /NCGR_PEP_ID=MMETSP0200_2-20121128/44_1 /TAXON_ID=947934 /ORGANISM="Chaetoceros sp., Strain GSL56" /LENGTH=382 /DNA_ID=CAMNT_0017872091 /DNA_START=48 /DNA_END=1196 /DNA_ORIENTATION=+